ncbi:MAG: hypothetical protein LBB19_00080, partial [Puniceicoccales bacterium]|nr:hypothetical protein [Puniceicoccales bacterium]
MAISGSSFQAPPRAGLQRSPAVANLRILDELNQIFAEESLQLLCDLANRFHQMRVTPDQVQQMVQMLTLPGDIRLPTRMEPVSQARLLQIVSNVTEFRCGTQQLVDLAKLCAVNGLHLCFFENDEYAFDLGNSLDNRNHNKTILYVGLPVNPEELCNNVTRNVAIMQDRELHIEQVKLIELLESPAKVNGYLVGHELSHATALAKCYPEVSMSSHNREIETFFNAICQQLTLESKELLQAHKALLERLLQDVLFQTGEEARNVLGLGMGEIFNRGNDPIVSEFDFLHEVQSAQLCMPMPYVPLERIRTEYPKVCMALLTLIFKLKEQSIADSSIKMDLNNPAMQSLKATLEESGVAKQNLTDTIQPQLASAGYEIGIGVRGDGNSGFYAILKALNPDQDYMYFIQGESVEQWANFPQWQAAAGLRHAIAGADPSLGHLREMVTTPLGTEDQQMGFDALPAVARHLNRPLVVINTTATDPNNVFAYYDQNGNQHGT